MPVPPAVSAEVRRPPEPDRRLPRPAAPRWPIALLVGLVAASLRWLPLANGGGLFGIGTATDATAYAAAVAVLQQSLPGPLAAGFAGYHGVLTTTSPACSPPSVRFALLGWHDEPLGLALARIAWMAMGTLTAVLVVALLRRHGGPAAALGGLCYAIHPAAVAGELTVSAVAPVSLLTVLALMVLQRARTGDRRGELRREVGRGIVLGLLIGLALTVSCWALPTVVVVLAVTAVHSGRTALVAVSAGLLAAVAVVVGPFLAAAPGLTWRLVVLTRWDGPRDVSSRPRLVEWSGLAPYADTTAIGTVLTVVLVTLLACVLVAAFDPFGRVVVVLLVCTGTAVLAVPGWDPVAAAALAPALAVVVGVAVGTAFAHSRGSARRAVVVAVAVVVAGLVAVAVPQTTTTVGRPFPGAELARHVYLRPGCVGSDDAVALVEMNVVRRNLERSCDPVVDLDAAYALAHLGEHDPVPPREDLVWQALVRTTFRSTDTMVLVRYRRGDELSARTAGEIASWWSVAVVGDVKLRQPTRH